MTTTESKSFLAYEKPLLKENDEEDMISHRGVFHIPHPEKVLFSEQIEIKIAELPRLQPHITIDRRMIEDEDD